MITKTFKIVNENEIPSDLLKDIYEDHLPDVFIKYYANTKETLEEEGFENDLLSNYLVTLGCEDGEEILIYL